MKTLIAASLLLALVIPAHASKFRESDRKWLPVMDIWLDNYTPCMKGQELDEKVRQPACNAMQKAERKLLAHGYCVYANGGVGRPSKDRKHCYTIDFPEPEPVMKHFKTPQ
jgi:hypothetical protein